MPDLGDLEDYLARLESRALLDGKSIRDLNADTLYMKVKGERDKLLQKVAEGKSEQELPDFLKRGLEFTDQKLKTKLKSTKGWQAFRKVTAGTVGAVVGSGALGHLLGQKTALAEHRRILKPYELPHRAPVPPAEIPEPPKLTELQPQTPPELQKIFAAQQAQAAEGLGIKAPGGLAETPATKIELLHTGKPTGAIVETHGQDLVVHAGNRGIEGALLDLKTQNPEKYQKMAAWLKENYTSESPGANNSDGTLVHRFVLEYGKDYDLSNLHVGPEGTIDFEIPEPSVAPPSSIPDTGGSEVAPEQHYIEGGEPPATSAPTPVTEGGPVSPEDPKVQIQGLESGATAPQTPLAPSELPASAVEKVAAVSGKLSEGLKAILAERYDSFVKNLIKVAPQNLEAVQDKTVWQFRLEYSDKFGGDSQFVGRYKGLQDFLTSDVNGSHLDDHYLKSVKIKDYILETAKAYKKAAAAG